MFPIIVIVLAGVIGTSQPSYSEQDLYVLSHIINAECGDNNCSHEQRIATGSVILNRVADEDFPDSIEEVVFQSNPVQYSPTVNGSYWNEPSEDSVEVAKYLLEEGSQLPVECVYQSGFVQGSSVYETFETIYGTTYICTK